MGCVGIPKSKLKELEETHYVCPKCQNVGEKALAKFIENAQRRYSKYGKKPTIEDDRELLTLQITEGQRKIAEYKQQIGKFTETIEKYKERAKEVHERSSKYESEINRTISKLKDKYRKKLENMTQQAMAQRNAAIMAQKHASKQFETLLSKEKSYLRKNANLQKELQGTKDELQSLTNDTQDKKESEKKRKKKEKKEHEQELNSLRTQLERASDQIEKYQVSHIAMQQQYKNDIQTHQSQIQVLQEENDRIAANSSGRIEDLTKQMNDDRQQYQNQIETYQTFVNSAEKQVASLQDQLRVAQSNSNSNNNSINNNNSKNGSPGVTSSGLKTPENGMITDENGLNELQLTEISLFRNLYRMILQHNLLDPQWFTARVQCQTSVFLKWLGNNDSDNSNNNNNNSNNNNNNSGIGDNSCITMENTLSTQQDLNLIQLQSLRALVGAVRAESQKGNQGPQRKEAWEKVLGTINNMSTQYENARYAFEKKQLERLLPGKSTVSVNYPVQDPKNEGVWRDNWITARFLGINSEGRAEIERVDDSSGTRFIVNMDPNTLKLVCFVMLCVFVCVCFIFAYTNYQIWFCIDYFCDVVRYT